MALIACPTCSSDDDIDVARVDQGTKTLRCGECGATWVHRAEEPRALGGRSAFDRARGRFATADMVPAERRRIVSRMKTRFLRTEQREHHVDDDVWADYRPMLTQEGLGVAAPGELREFSRRSAAQHGRPMVLRRAWDTLGEEEAARRTVVSLTYLLHGPIDVPLEDRLTNLLVHGVEDGIAGLSEVFYMHVLHVASPARFLPGLGYDTADVGKRDVARLVFGLSLPKVDPTAMQIGRMATWSNDLLVDLAGPGFRDTTQVAAFLTWARDRTDRAALEVVR